MILTMFKLIAHNAEEHVPIHLDVLITLGVVVSVGLNRDLLLQMMQLPLMMELFAVMLAQIKLHHHHQVIN